MDKSIKNRNQVGFLFLSSYKNWAGGVIYILNLIRALNHLSDDKKPEIVIFYVPDSPIQDALAINYPYFKIHPLAAPSLYNRAILKLHALLTGKSKYFNILPDILYPYNKNLFFGKKPIHWVPDFQEHYFPELFSKSELTTRKRHRNKIANSKDIVIFSSQDALNDFNKFYPQNRCTSRLLRFASILPKFEHLNISHLRNKYEIEDIYFMSPNQFWEHKNHTIILEAINILKKTNLSFQVVFTGSQQNASNKDYFQRLSNFIENNKIQRWVKFLGFIDREEQLSLMKNSQAIIQASLFEGWSTLVEDTKALNHFILLSDLPVHREQIDTNCLFFDPKSPLELAKLIEKSLNSPLTTQTIDYQKNIKEFSDNILKVLEI